MAMVATVNEERVIMNIESIYGALREATKRVASARQFHYSIMNAEPKSRFSFFKNLFRKKEEVSDDDNKLAQLLDALTILKAEFEVNMPLIIEGKIYFVFQGQPKGRNCIRQVGESRSENDLFVYVTDLQARLSEILVRPEISNAISSPLFTCYCPSLTRANLRFSDACQKYLQ